MHPTDGPRTAMPRPSLIEQFKGRAGRPEWRRLEGLRGAGDERIQQAAAQSGSWPPPSGSTRTMRRSSSTTTPDQKPAATAAGGGGFPSPKAMGLSVLSGLSVGSSGSCDCWRDLAAHKAIGTPFAYHKFKDGIKVDFVGYHIAYESAGLLSKRTNGSWLDQHLEAASGWSHDGLSLAYPHPEASFADTPLGARVATGPLCDPVVSN